MAQSCQPGSLSCFSGLFSYQTHQVGSPVATELKSMGRDLFRSPEAADLLAMTAVQFGAVSDIIPYGPTSWTGWT